MKRFWILALAVSVGLNAGLLYVVVLSKGEEGHRPPPGSGRPPPGAHFEGVLDAHLRRMTESLGLDDQQRTTIAALHQTLLPKIREQHRTKDRLRRELAELYASPSFEPADSEHSSSNWGRRSESSTRWSPKRCSARPP